MYNKRKKGVIAMTDLKDLLELGGKIIASEDTRRLLCGSYSDGTTRNIADAINGEMLSPAQKELLYNKPRSKKKKKDYIPYECELKEKKKKKKNKKKDKKKKKKKDEYSKISKKKKKKDKDRLGIDMFIF